MAFLITVKHVCDKLIMLNIYFKNCFMHLKQGTDDKYTEMNVS